MVEGLSNTVLISVDCQCANQVKNFHNEDEIYHQPSNFLDYWFKNLGGRKIGLLTQRIMKILALVAKRLWKNFRVAGMSLT